MKPLTAAPDWPESWRGAFAADSAEFWGSGVNLGYTYSYQRRFWDVINSVERMLPRGERVLDLAAAQGNFTLALAERGYHVVWNDLRDELEGYVKLKFESGDVRYRPGNAFELGNDELGGPFDAVLATEIVEHVAHPDQFLAAIACLCRPGGLIFITTPNGQYFRNRLPQFSDFADTTELELQQFRPDVEGHLFLFHDQELERLAESAGLELVLSTLHTSPIIAGDGWLGKVLRFIPARPVLLVGRIHERLPRWLRRRTLMHLSVVLRRRAEKS